MNPFQSGTRFRAELRHNAGFDIPDEVGSYLGGGRAAVLVTVNGYSFRGEVSRTPRGYWLGLSPWRRAAGRITSGRLHEVVIEPDLPRVG
ncbi:DUF1905 domain-containing protein, partial [Actinoplanes sp. TFC3]|uniref:DUF1905 domain-containing protein n=1 Tax=Actinoplanes sp. TFC3 TaxID=1710355 RepID=UPI0012900C76